MKTDKKRNTKQQRLHFRKQELQSMLQGLFTNRTYSYANIRKIMNLLDSDENYKVLENFVQESLIFDVNDAAFDGDDKMHRLFQAFEIFDKGVKTVAAAYWTIDKDLDQQSLPSYDLLFNKLAQLVFGECNKVHGILKSVAASNEEPTEQEIKLCTLVCSIFPTTGPCYIFKSEQKSNVYAFRQNFEQMCQQLVNDSHFRRGQTESLQQEYKYANFSFAIGIPGGIGQTKIKYIMNHALRGPFHPLSRKHFLLQFCRLSAYMQELFDRNAGVVKIGRNAEKEIEDYMNSQMSFSDWNHLDEIQQDLIQLLLNMTNASEYIGPLDDNANKHVFRNDEDEWYLIIDENNEIIDAYIKGR